MHNETIKKTGAAPESDSSELITFSAAAPAFNLYKVLLPYASIVTIRA